MSRPRNSQTHSWAGRLVALVACSLLLVACDSDSSDSDPDSINGTWSGTLGSQTVEMTLAETAGPIGGSTVAGSGTVTSSARSVTFQVTGTYVHPFLSLDATFDVPPGSNPTGSVNGQVNAVRTEIVATFTGPGIDGQITFSLQD